MDKFIYVQSNDSSDYFPDNTPSSFKIHLQLPLTLPGLWKVGLIEFHAQANVSAKSKKQLQNETLFIYTDLCKDSIVQGREQPLLRRLDSNTKTGWSHAVNQVVFLPMKKQHLIEFEVYIRDEDGKEATFLKEPLWMLLQLKPYPFYSDYESI